MADVTRQRVGELQRGVFKILLDHPEGLPAKETISRMVQVVPPTAFEKSDYPNHPGSQRFGWMIRFATIAPVKAGWLIKEKGKWYLTEEGKKAYLKYEDPVEFRREGGRLYRQWLDKRPNEIASTEEEFHQEIGTSESVAGAARWLEHWADVDSGKDRLAYEFVDGMQGLPKQTARIWEQRMIKEYGLKRFAGQLLNEINSIAPKYWRSNGIL